MPQLNASVIAIFRAGDWSGVAPNQVFTPDTGFLYAMIDANILSNSLAGLPAAQQTTINGYVYTPTASDYATRGFPTWAGNSPSPVYFKIAEPVGTKLTTALAKYYK